MVTVAKQIDFVLGYVLTGKDAHLGIHMLSQNRLDRLLS